MFFLFYFFSFEDGGGGVKEESTLSPGYHTAVNLSSDSCKIQFYHKCLSTMFSSL